MICIGIVPCKSGYAASSFGVISVGGSTHSAVSDLTECQLICSLEVTCVGLDYDGSVTPAHCVTHDSSTFNSGRTTSNSDTVVQYTKVDSCLTSKQTWKITDVWLS